MTINAFTMIENSILKKIIAYSYEYVVFISLMVYYAYHINEASKPLGLFFLSLIVFVIYVVYIAINHLFVKKIIAHKILLIIESLLLVALLSIFYSNIMYETHKSDLWRVTHGSQQVEQKY